VQNLLAANEIKCLSQRRHGGFFRKQDDMPSI
jgi:hypothetical protein